MRLSQRDAFGEHLVLTIHEEAHNGLPTGTQSESHIVVKISAIPKYRLLQFINKSRNDNDYFVIANKMKQSKKITDEVIFTSPVQV